MDTSEMFLEDEIENIDPSSKKSTRRGFDYGTIAAYLLRGVVYRENNQNLWNELLEKHGKVSDLLTKLGVRMVIDEPEGYAYVRSLTEEELPDGPLPPKLMVRRQLPFNVSFMLLLLRHKLVEFDSEESGTRLVLSLSEIMELYKTYVSGKSNEVRLETRIETLVNKIIDLGFLRPLQDKKSKGEKHYEVLRILKAYFDAQRIADISEKIEEYLSHLKDEDGMDIGEEV